MSNVVEILPIMNNSKLPFFLGCVAAVMLSAPVLTAAPRGGSGGGHGGHFMGGRPGMAGRPGMGAWGGQRWGGGNWHGGSNWHGGGNWHGGHHHGNDVIFIGSFGFPWGWGWGWDPWGWGYPYGYGYGYGYPYGYGSGDPYGYGYGSGYGGYGYGDQGYGQGYGNYGNASPTHSRVAELQRRLAHAGYYHGSVDGVLGPQTRRAIRAYERDHGYASSN